MDDSPSRGFPWERVQAAQRYLYAIKPWWRRFGDRMEVTPISVEPPPGEPYGALTSTDTSFRLYVDRSFALSAPLHVLAGALEHEYQHHTRDTWDRFGWMGRDEFESLGNVCMDLEINTAIRREIDSLDMDGVRVICSRSPLFRESELAKWGVVSPPGLDDIGWQPELVGLPSGCSAEQYYRMIKQPPDESDPLEDEDDQGGETQEGDEQGEHAEGASDEDGEGEEQGSEGSEGSVQSGGSTTGQGSGEGSGQDQTQGRADSSDAPGEQSEDGQRSESPQEAIDRLREQSTEHSWWSQECSQHGEPNPSWKPDREEGSSGSESTRESAKRELAEDVMEHARSPSLSFRIDPGDAMVDWSRATIDRIGLSWQSILSKVLSSSLSTARVSGASDLSYSVRNPNQPQVGPVLMGMHDYAPNLTVVQDVSGSMRDRMAVSMGAFKDLVKASVSRYGEKVTWVTVDSVVQDVGRALRLDRATQGRWGVGFGGTVIKDTLEELAAGRFRFRGKRYPRPDVVIVSTDCAFEWPWVESKPPSKPKMVVCSVEPYELARQFLPNWVSPKARNFIYVDDG